MENLQQEFFTRLLVPGDVLLYNGSSVFSWLIRRVSNGSITHVEVYQGSGKSMASRDGEGVGTYPLRVNGLVAILRPKGQIRIKDAIAYHNTRVGAKYDWLGLVRSFVGNKWLKNDEKAWCSEYVDEVMQAAGVNSFPEDSFSTAITPWDFWQSLAYRRVWVDKDWSKKNVKVG